MFGLGLGSWLRLGLMFRLGVRVMLSIGLRFG